MHVAVCPFSCAIFLLRERKARGSLSGWYGAYICTLLPYVNSIVAWVIARHCHGDMVSSVWAVSANFCNGIEGRTEIAVAIAGQFHSRKNFRKLNYKMNGTNLKGLHRIKKLSYSSLTLTEIDSQRIIE